MKLMNARALAPATAMIVAAGCLLGACQNKTDTSPVAAAAPEIPYHPRATIAEIMDSMVMPAADVIWNSTAVTETLEGEQDSRPKTDEDWKVVERAGVVLSEAFNAVMIPGRHVDKPGAVSANPGSELNPDQIEELIRKEPQVWLGFAQAIDGTVEKAQAAIRDRNFDAISEVGGELDEICENCHLHFWYPPQQKSE